MSVEEGQRGQLGEACGGSGGTEGRRGRLWEAHRYTRGDGGAKCLAAGAADGWRMPAGCGGRALAWHSAQRVGPPPPPQPRQAVPSPGSTVPPTRQLHKGRLQHIQNHKVQPAQAPQAPPDGRHRPSVRLRRRRRHSMAGGARGGGPGRIAAARTSAGSPAQQQRRQEACQAGPLASGSLPRSILRAVSPARRLKSEGGVV